MSKEDTVPQEGNNIELHHASIDEIMGTPPARMSLAGSGILLLVILCMLVGSRFITYEDKILTSATLQGSSPHLVVSPEEGRISLLDSDEFISPGDTLMWISSAATGGKIPLIADCSGELEINPALHIQPYVKRNDTVGQIWEQQNQPVLCRIEIPSSEMNRIRVGDRVRLSLEKYPAESYGTVETTVKSISDFDQTLSVQLLAELPDHIVTSKNVTLTVKGGLTAKAEIVIGEQNLFNRLVNPFRGLLGKK